MIFHKKNLFQKKKLTIEELAQYYADLRLFKFNNGVPLKGLKIRKCFHFIVSFVLKVDQILSKEEVIVDNKIVGSKDKPTIFAFTHVGGNDVQRAFQAIKGQAHLMLGDPGELYREAIYLVLLLNGVISFDTANKPDRKVAYNRAVELLNRNGNLLIFPEGAWNVSVNEFVLKLFPGTVRMAKETGAEIIPIGLEQYDGKFIFNVGKSYTIDKNNPKTEKELTDELREKLATLKWEIIEKQPRLIHSEIPENYTEIFQKNIIGACNYGEEGFGFQLEDAFKEMFHDKNITTKEVAFAHLKMLTPNLNSAFLFNKRILY